MNNEEKILSLLEKHGEMLESLTDRMAKVEVTQENMVLPQIQAIAEGITSINAKLVTRSEMDAMREEIAFLKDIIRMHTTQINDLKKAE
ncbi:hypothetical protein QVN85_06810 [Oscillibacter valericigenes]|uniref:hypothetical protein n=1 Tax=Oscillibacter ruminantium TaxID=1263547 RepID=UPI0025AAA1DE|nr:hypothetical protein [Oscillibacter valericigenes]